MISAERIKLVEILLAKGHKRRAIAEKAGVSKSTVDRVAAGKRRPIERVTRPDPPAAEYQRCPHCGAMVIMPCVLAEVENAGCRHEPIGQSGGAPPSGPQLRPEHDRPYRTIKARKMAEDRAAGRQPPAAAIDAEPVFLDPGRAA